ncbi:hypothetical protein PF008_g23232 [Phytophthora fragariae]|uniref:Uncharacterized protein n=1 Tax=Phytophthora fragariae TaxID=53985 RepID=A0A6G0QSF2_9STRA|nr:hypothetical protein PF008_g23232 [Phytophthora fragariae]
MLRMTYTVLGLLADSIYLLHVVLVDRKARNPSCVLVVTNTSRRYCNSVRRSTWPECFIAYAEANTAYRNSAAGNTIFR